MTDASIRLRSLADRLIQAYGAHSRPRAALLVGSAARGDADAYSDLDLVFYYDEPPAETALAAARAEVAAERATVRADPDAGGYSERYDVEGIQCQLGHTTIESFHGVIAKLVVDLELDEVGPKILMGLFEGVALHGADLVERWRGNAAYTVELQRAMIRRHWTFFPWWFFEQRLRARDTTVWRYEVLVRAAYSLVGVLAALNRVYFSTLELKRAGAFLSRLEVAPPELAARLEALFEADEPASTAELERLVAETETLVAERFPDLDLSLTWGGKATPPGSRERSWS